MTSPCVFRPMHRAMRNLILLLPQVDQFLPQLQQKSPGAAAGFGSSADGWQRRQLMKRALQLYERPASRSRRRSGDAADEAKLQKPSPPQQQQPQVLRLPTQLKTNGWTDLGQGARAAYFPGSIPPGSSAALLETLQRDVPWLQRNVSIMGRSVPQPRLVCYMADPGLSYTYSGLTLQPTPWSPEVLRIKAAVERLAGAGCCFNSCLLNHYRDGRDHISWHSDNEALYGPSPTIASVTLGAGRDFVLRHAQQRSHKISVALAAGDVLLMAGSMQQHWQHSLPQRKKVSQPRISLTFRTIIRPET